MPNKPNVLTVAEFLKLKGTKGPVVVYFNGDQWANLTRDIKPGKGKPPDKTMTLTLTELPGLPGGLGTFGCPIECSGPIRGGGGKGGRRTGVGARAGDTVDSSGGGAGIEKPV